VARAPSITGSTSGGGGGGGGNAATEIGELSFLEDMTAGSKTTTGAFTIYAADGTTVKATGQITTTGSITSAWAVEWDTSYGIRVTGVTKNTGSGGTVTVAINPAASVFASANWSKDDVVAQVVYGASVSAGTGAIYYGAAPYGSTSLGVSDGRSIKGTVTGGTVAWTTERWGNYDNDSIVSLGSSAIPASAVYLQEGRDLQNRIKLGASDYIDPAQWYDTAWDGRGIGQMLVTVSDDPATSRYTAAGGYALILSANNNDAANPSSSELRKAKFYARNEAPETAGTGGALVGLVDWSAVSYNFLTTGGTGGSGGAGPHTVGGRTWNLTLTGSGPTRLELVSGVLHNESTLANRGTLDTDLGASVGDTSYVIYASTDNATRAGAANSLGLFWGTASTVNSNNQGAILLGSASATDLLVRECTGVGSFTTVNNATITDYTTTPTLLGVVVNGGGWTDCHSQGSSTLPTDGGTFGTVGPKQWGENGAQTIQDRRYLIVQLVYDLDLRLAAHEQRIAP